MFYISRFKIRQEFKDPALFVYLIKLETNLKQKHDTNTRWPGDNSNKSFRSRPSEKKYIQNEIKTS